MSAPRLRDAAFTGVAVALGISTLFGAYAYLAPATYRSTATVVLTQPHDGPGALDPLDAERRVRAALLPVDGASLDAATTDGRTFELSCLKGSAVLAQEACARLAREAVEQMPKLFAIEPASHAALDPERQRNAEALVALLAEHPELRAEAKERPASETTDPILKALRGERAALEARLATGPVASTDNPYADPASVDPDVPQVRRRLVQISKEMDARRELIARANGTRKPIAPELRARWQELLKGAAAPTTGVVARAQPTASIAADASLPSAPLTPNRPLLLLIGLLTGTGAGAVIVVLRALRASRDRLSDPVDVRTADSSSFEGASEPTRPLALLDFARTSPPLLPAPPPAWADSNAEAPRDPGTNALPDLSGSAGVEGAPTTARAGTASIHDDPFGLAERTGSNPAEPVESSSQTRESHARENSGIELVERASKVPVVRTTQTLGSPIPPAPPGADARTDFHAPGYRPPSGIGGTQYSFVSAPPGFGAGDHGRAGRDVRPISTPPPPRPSSAPPLREPISEPRRISTHPPSPPSSHVTGSAVPRSLVTPHPVPPGWCPDVSLVPAARRALSDEIYPLAVGQCFVLGVSGVRGAGDDTARVAAELALALAETGHPRILLLEGNLQRPAIHRLLRIEMPLFAGFSEQLERRIQSGNQGGTWNAIACSNTLHVIAEGVMRIPELILSRQFEDAVTELRNYYDVIVIDGPLIPEAAACRAVHDVVDGVVLVCPKAGANEIAEATALFSHKRFSTVLAAG